MLVEQIKNNISLDKILLNIVNVGFENLNLNKYYFSADAANQITRKALATPSRSIRFAASAAKFSISKCLSCPEKQFYQINRVFHIF